ncbi:sugar transferase [Micromonospora sp. NPDC005707]|uniref:sugar transferase n=1 Tax=Micromonospora sp. NPDC005707 TaxID=3157050 RepID=UPI0033C6214C
MSMDWQRAAKRVIDIVGAALILAVTAPAFLIAAALIRVELGAPIIFTQQRTGRWLQPFRIYKLRTMTEERDAQGRLLSDGERCPPVGRLIRRLSIDELPQLVNVLRGDLSLVGPRPLLPRYDPWYTDRERLRFSVRPGITGLAQVNGRNHLAWADRLELDVRYVLDWSLRLDLRIIRQTFSRVLRASGLAVDPSARMLDLDEERRVACNR